MLQYDLARVTLELRPTHNDTVPGWLGRVAQAVYLKAMQRIAPEVSAAVHDSQSYHPYTVSDVLPLVKTELRDLSRSQPLTLVLTTLHHQVTRLTLNAVIPQWQKDGLDLHGQRLKVINAEVEAATFEALLAEGHTQTKRHIPLRFLTPTSTKKSRRRGERNERRESQVVPLPMPDRIFGSLYDRWNFFAPQPLPEALRAEIDDEIAIHYANIHTHYVDRERANKGGTVGFVGDVTFFCTSRDFLGYVHALAAFARYSGVGIKTTQGMGTVAMQPVREKEALP